METFYLTDVGKVRDHNEDSVIIVKNDNGDFVRLLTKLKNSLLLNVMSLLNMKTVLKISKQLSLIILNLSERRRLHAPVDELAG